MFDDIENIDHNILDESSNDEPVDEETNRQDERSKLPVRNVNRNKRSAATTQKTATKRIRSNPPSTSNSTIVHSTGDSMVSSHLTELNHNIIQLRRQLVALSETNNQQQKTMSLLLHNQKKMTKAMRAHRVRNQIVHFIYKIVLYLDSDITI